LQGLGQVRERQREKQKEREREREGERGGVVKQERQSWS
jgi:hypothetical protein